MEFETYLKGELERKSNNADYDPNGNSQRAIATRGLMCEILWQYKDYPRRVKGELDCFDGLETEIGWFIQLPVMIILAPVIPVFAGRYHYNRAIARYRLDYDLSL